MCCGNPLQGKLLPVGWKLAQWSYELEKKATPHQGIWMSTRPSCFFHWLRFSQGDGQKKAKLCKMSTATCIPRRSPIQVLTGLDLA